MGKAKPLVAAGQPDCSVYHITAGLFPFSNVRLMFCNAKCAAFPWRADASEKELL
jgi:hypothetical protein